MKTQDKLISGKFDSLDVSGALLLAEGDLEMLKVIAVMLADQIEEELPLLQRHCAEKDSASLLQAAHRLKGSVSYFGSSPAYLACVHLEALGAEEILSEFDSGMARLEIELNRMVPELRRLVVIAV